jgi:diguanylate cyclase (GGDEF)-like protein
MLDIDNFKPLNDTYGHDFGDYVLIHVCNIVRETLRSDDFFARYGGEEFVIVLPKTDIGSAFDVGKKICRQIEKSRAKMGDKVVSVTISIGLTEVHEEDTTLYDLINRADKKLYQAKRNGKNRVEV